MINIELIKHITKYELRWKSWFYFFAFIGVILTLLIMTTAPDDTDFIIILVGIIVPLMLAVSSPLIASIGPQNNNANQNGFFSWKYIHSIVHKRKDFIFAYCIAGLAASVPAIIFLIGAAIYFKYPPLAIIMAIFILLLLITFFRLQIVIGTIHLPRVAYYHYHDDSPLILWIKKLGIFLHKILHYISLGMIISLSLFGTIYFKQIYLTLTVSIVLIILLILLSYKFLIKIWYDERLSRWKVSRMFKKTLFYFAIAGSLLTLFIHFEDNGFFNQTKIFMLIKENQVNEIKRLNINEQILTSTNDSERTPLLEAVHFSRPKITQYLLSQGANANDRDKNGISALAFAAARCDLETAQYLITAGADINIPSPKGLTPIFFSMYPRGCITMTEFLIKMGADTTITNNKGQDYLQFARETFPIRYKEIIFRQKLE